MVSGEFVKASNLVRLVTHRVFQPTPSEPLDFEATIEATLLELSRRYKIRKVLFDPYQMQSTAQRLTKQRIPIEEFPQSSPNLTAASQNLYDLIQSQGLIAYPDAAIRLAISRAIAIESPRGWRIAKEKQSHKIDVVVALAMAAHACVQGQSEPAPFNTRYHEWVDGLPSSADPAADARAAWRKQQFEKHLANCGVPGFGFGGGDFQVGPAAGGRIIKWSHR